MPTIRIIWPGHGVVMRRAVIPAEAGIQVVMGAEGHVTLARSFDLFCSVLIAKEPISLLRFSDSVIRVIHP